MTMSLIINAGFSRRAATSAWAPVAAVVTRYPCTSSRCLRCSACVGLSSTIKIRVPAPATSVEAVIRFSSGLFSPTATESLSRAVSAVDHRNEPIRDPGGRPHVRGAAQLDRFPRHAVHDGAVEVLSDRDGACVFQQLQFCGSVFT